MKKNTIIKLLAVLVMCFMIGAVLVACGETGPQGEKGDKGDTGAAGAPGADGVTPTVEIVDGYWHINGEDTGVKAEAIDAVKCEEHTWISYELSKHEAGHVGMTLKICDVCGFAAAEVVGHNYVVLVDGEGSFQAPTAEEEGYQALMCDLEGCNAVGQAVLPTLMSRVYYVERGDCKDPTDTYYYSIFDTINGSHYEYPYNWDTDSEITFTVEGDYPHTPKVAFDEANLDTTVWTKADLTDPNACVCQVAPIYTAKCTVDGCTGYAQAEGTAPDHVWGEYHLTANTTGTCDCEWAPVELATCTVCDCEDCVITRSAGEAPGHSYTAWEKGTDPTATAAGTLTRTCENCNHAVNTTCEGVFTYTLNAFLDDEFGYAVETVLAVTCEKAGTYNFSYTLDGVTYTWENVTVAALGHTFNDECAYEVTVQPTADSTGTVAITCATCGEAVEYTLAAIDDTAYEKTTSTGDCHKKIDTYTCVVTADGNDHGSIEVSFDVKDQYTHSEVESIDDCIVYVDEAGNTYYLYQCTNDGCGVFVVYKFVEAE